MRQTEDWNCGGTVLIRLLDRFNVRLSQENADFLLSSTPDDGTSHDSFKRVLAAKGLRYLSSDGSFDELISHLPAIVNFQYEGDGHYGIAETWSDGRINVWDPWTGGMLSFSQIAFEALWYSDRYGPKWWLHVLVNQP